nr:hypothetical protein CFP56_70416 [Quercus suber]
MGRICREDRRASRAVPVISSATLSLGSMKRTSAFVQRLPRLLEDSASPSSDDAPPALPRETALLRREAATAFAPREEREAFPPRTTRRQHFHEKQRGYGGKQPLRLRRARSVKRCCDVRAQTLWPRYLVPEEPYHDDG